MVSGQKMETFVKNGPGISIICLDGLGRTKDRICGITSPRRGVMLPIPSYLISIQVVPVYNLDRAALLSFSWLFSVTRFKYRIMPSGRTAVSNLLRQTTAK
jgi:hypothetical protein